MGGLITTTDPEVLGQRSQTHHGHCVQSTPPYILGSAPLKCGHHGRESSTGVCSR